MTARGLRRWATQAFAAFGVVVLLLQSYQAIWNRPLFAGHVVTVVAVASVAAGLWRAGLPRGL